MSKRRVKPNQLPIAIGVLVAAVTVASGIAATTLQFHDDSPITREVFGGVPSAWKLVFYTVLPVLFVYGAVLFSQRVKNWERGQPDNRATTSKNVAQAPEGLPGRRLHADAAARPRRRHHALADLLRLPDPAGRHHGARDQPPAAGGRQVPPRRRLPGATRSSATSPAWCSSSACCWAIVRRYVQRPYRIRIKSKPEHALILGTFLAIGVTGFGAEAFRIAETGRPEFEKWSFVG